MAINIPISNAPPYGTPCLKDMPRILPIKNAYYPTPLPFQPIINYLTNPPWSLPSYSWNSTEMAYPVTW